jgi:ABC-type multidrug transport system ATPase subunit
MKEQENQILKVQDLEKFYHNGTKAVNGVNLKLYQDQIFILLGHNGAGKTTTISMLSGLFEPTKGSATVFGKNLCGGDNYSARRTMGVCP